MFFRVRYLPLGVKNVQQKIVYVTMRDRNDFGVSHIAKVLGCLESDVKSVDAVA